MSRGESKEKEDTWEFPRASPADGTLLVQVSIPLNRSLSGKEVEALVVEMCQILEDRFSAVEDDYDETFADGMGFGGNVVWVESCGYVEEICL